MFADCDLQCVFAEKTVGTLLSRSYQNGPALIGAIFGTGTNGAYIDKVETIEKLGKEAIAESQKGGPDAGEFMVINTEWGAIDNGVSFRYSTPFYRRSRLIDLLHA